MNRFREIDVSGDARERGLLHGQQLTGEIALALDFYRDVFRLPDNVVLEQARHFRNVIGDFNADYADEIAGIAEGCGQDALWITALNARTEILALLKAEEEEAKAKAARPVFRSRASVNECTSMCFTGSSVLGQTWDWGQPLEALCAMMRIKRPDGHVIRMLTEPGIIGKIGMNSAGLGVCLNILTLGEKLEGVPIHVMLRAILDCASADEAADTIDRAPLGKSSNVMVADKSGHCFDREFAGDETLSPDYGDGNMVHTNHYLGKEINAAGDPLFYNSHARMRRASERVAGADSHTTATMCDILSDQSHKTFPVYRPYVADEDLGSVGTVATIVMDLPAGTMHVRKGADPASGFVSYSA